jgi:hypothetical protein
MTTTKVKTSELVGAALDWAVAICLNGSSEFFAAFGARMLGGLITEEVTAGNIRPSTDWAQGGPLIDKHIHLISQDGKGGMYAQCVAEPTHEFGEGPTILIAACRAIVAAKLGDTVEIPTELLEVVQ